MEVVSLLDEKNNDTGDVFDAEISNFMSVGNDGTFCSRWIICSTVSCSLHIEYVGGEEMVYEKTYFRV